MPSYTILDVKNLVRSHFANSDLVPDTLLLTFINEAVKDVAVKCLCYEKKISVSSGSLYPGQRFLRLPVPSSIIKANYIEIVPTDTTVNPIGLIKISPMNIGHIELMDDYLTGWFQWGRYIIFEPIIPATVNFSLNIYTSCYPDAKFTADTDLLSLYAPNEYQRCVVLYTYFLMCLKLRNLTQAGIAYNNYVQSVNQCRFIFTLRTTDTRNSRTIPDNVIIGGSNNDQ